MTPRPSSRAFSLDSLEARLVMAAPVIHNLTIPTYGPLSPTAGALTVTYESVIDYAAITTDGGNPATLVLTLNAGDITKNGTPVNNGDTLGPGESFVWNPLVANRTPGITGILTLRARDGTDTAADVLNINARIGTTDLGQDGPFDVAPGTRIDASQFLDSPSTPDINVTYRNDLGDAILIARDDESTPWDRQDITDNVDSHWFPQVTSNVLSWEDIKDAGQFGYAAANSAAGLQLVTVPINGSTFTTRNLNTELPGSPTLVGEIDTFKSIDGLVYIAGRTAAGDVVVFHQTGFGTAGNYAWVAENLYDGLRTLGEATPTLVGHLAPYVTSWNGLNIAGLTSTGEIWGIWTAPGIVGWRSSNLTTITGAPTLVGGLSVFLTSWDAINIAGLDVNGHVTATWWIPSFGGNWQNADYSTLFGFGPLRQETMTTYVTSWGALNIVGLDRSDVLHTYWWDPSRAGTANDVWTDSNITVSGTPFAVNSRLSVLTTTDTRINIFGTDAFGAVQRIWWQPSFGGTWQTDQL